MLYQIKNKEKKLQNERENHRAFSIAAISADGEKADNYRELADKAAARIDELETEIEELQRNFENVETQNDSSLTAKENRKVVQFTSDLKKEKPYTYDVNTTEWCANIAKLQQIHAGEDQSDDTKHAFYQSVCGLVNTVAFNSWTHYLKTENKTGNTTDLLMFLEEHYGEKTTIYQSLLELWSMKKDPSSSYTETAHMMEYKLQKSMIIIQKTYKRIKKTELTVEAFSNIVAGMVYSELARNADPEVFKHATKDLEECFTPSEIATKLKFYQDQFGKSDAVTTAEKAAANTFYGSNPKVANANGKKRSNGGRRGRGNNRSNRGNRNNHKADNKGENKIRTSDRCQYELHMPNGCTRSDCPYRHESRSGSNTNFKHRSNAGTSGNDGNNAYHAQTSYHSPQSMTSPPQAMTSPPQPMTASPAMMSHVTNSMFSNGPDADFHSC